MTEHVTAVLDNYEQHFAANEIAIAVKHAMILVGVTKNVCFWTALELNNKWLACEITQKLLEYYKPNWQRH